ncbi:Flp family type IVb pilin [Alloalcanivorax xenomutans]|uniref:Flp family type IVb pilin n=1 Tax=Alloalcanivorax xenomutans TaxID=1094342 RepID=UPI00047B92E6
MKMIQSFNTAIQSLMVRLFTQMPTRSNRQRGATALEYIMLAAVIIAILVYLSTQTDVQDAIKEAYENIFDKGKEAANTAAGGGTT